MGEVTPSDGFTVKAAATGDEVDPAMAALPESLTVTWRVTVPAAVVGIAVLPQE